MMTTKTTDRISTLNDRLRSEGVGGRVMMTSGVAALDAPTRLQLLDAVRSFSDFSADNDPYGEHDFGAVEIGGRSFFWKVDAYDLSLTRASPDPTDNTITARVLTIMVADEY